MGSSQIHEGLDCEVFEARFPGRTCRNLGIAGGTPLDMLFLMDQVDRRVSRRIVITGVFPGTLHRGPKAAFTDTETLACVFRSGLWSHLDATEWIELLYGQMQSVSRHPAGRRIPSGRCGGSSVAIPAPRSGADRAAQAA